MKQYIYSATECGLSEWPSGTLRLEGIPVTDNPAEADLFVYPGALHNLRPPDLDKLPYMKGNEIRHVFLHCSDDEDLYGKPCLFIRRNLRPWNFRSDPNSIVWNWDVADLANITPAQLHPPKGKTVEVPEYLRNCVELPPDGFIYDVTFWGWNSSLVRKVSATSCRDNPKIKADIAIHPDFYGHKYEGTEIGHHYRKEFLRSLKESRMVLCPESIPGVLPYRFFEALSAGRYPLLICRNFSLPFADEIPYDDFISKIDIDMADEAGDVIAEIRSRHTDEVFVEKGQAARKYWLKYLTGDPKTMTYAVLKKMKELGLTKEEPVLV